VLAFASTAHAASVFYIRGGGNGHGVGMSQYGAYGYALHGKSYRWILAHYYRATTLSTTSPTENVRVLLSSGAASFSGATAAGGKKLKPGLTYTVKPNADGTLTLVNSKGKRIGTFSAPLTATGPGPLSLASVGTYHGALEFRPDGAGGVETIDVVALDDYVRGVIGAEIPSSWPEQALEAQAVAARTYALTSDAGGSTFGLYADTRSQMYGGVGAETPQTAAAVDATRGEIVTYNGAPATTYFFSSSGGHTENVEDVWPGSTPEPWLRGVPDPYDGAGHNPYHRWSYAMSVPNAQAKLGSLVKGSLVGIRVTEHGSSPRILQAQVVGTRGTTTVSGAELQRIFKLRTTYAAFTTMATAPGHNPAGAHGTRAGPETQAVAALVPLVDDLAGAITGVHGSVFPARQGVTVTIERKTRRGWRAVGRTKTRHGGGFDVPVPGPGTYRIVYQGLYGPAVTVG
jgi:stage II sporulation protein D